MNKKITENKKILIIGIAIVILILLLVIKIIDNKYQKNNSTNTEYISSIETEKEETFQEEKIIIYITGEVNKEGVIELPEGSRIADAIEKAEGVTENANLKNVNLAFKVEDGQKINIPNKNDNTQDDIEKEQKEKNNNEKNNVSKTEKIDEDSNNYITKSNGQNIIVDDGKNENANKNSKVNINTATQTELETLNGIGPSTASKIIKYRNEKGKFKKIEDIKNVSGIGEAKFKKIEADIVV